ncbi:MULTISPECIES: hypothetical protein [Pseudomonas]|uniref:hypothetical protein n=1 Tax=Pseudomonas TaxID=286 RepID=UPI00111BF08E|nr:MULTISPECIES: hypothetical protein [Pseudomonas]
MHRLGIVMHAKAFQAELLSNLPLQTIMSWAVMPIRTNFPRVVVAQWPVTRLAPLFNYVVTQVGTDRSALNAVLAKLAAHVAYRFAVLVIQHVARH